MPATVVKVGEKYRVVEADTGAIVRNDKGAPVDGGGHDTRQEALDQARAINASKKRG